jgi:hypothetical protein
MDDGPSKVGTMRSSAGFDNHILRAADHHQMLDIIAPDEHETALLVDLVKFADGKAPPFAAANAAPPRF